MKRNEKRNGDGGNVPRHRRVLADDRGMARLLEEGIDPSVGSVGDSYDNAMAESIIGLFWKNGDGAEVLARWGILLRALPGAKAIVS